jgi:transcriptional regulator with XRE-family HTH domain
MVTWLAQRTGYSEIYVKHIKLGISPPSAEFRERCSLALDLPESILFLGDDLPMTRRARTGAKVAV